ncbi:MULTISPECIES: DotH/IcmK family type IV secretion protein [Vibrio]|nr:DotH/IcmK family type IV secretion protein [Vibrio tasmaniensis]PMO80337.1 hypothetical protein BCT01_08580 [Vibrio tasmaniensis]PMP17795.1 hypothetical protein BCS92_05150 [Vibrio tasmaniensis]
MSKYVKMALLGLVVTLNAFANEDLKSGDIDSLLAQTISEQAIPEVSKDNEVSEAEVMKSDKTQNEKKRDKKQANHFIRSINEDGYSTAEYDKKREILTKILSQTDDPKSILETLIAEGPLSNSFNDIFLLRLVADELQRAKNSPLLETEIINDQYSVDHTDRFKMYDIYVHDSGETLLEFLDVTGHPWPIFDFSPTKSLETRKGELNMLWINPLVKHVKTSLFVSLSEYSAPIQFNIRYSNDKRHGFASFKLPFISPINPNVNKAPSNTNFDLEISTASKEDGQITIREQLDSRELSYLASTGRFRDKTKLKQEAIPVMVSDPSIATVWFYNGNFIVRTPNQLYSFDRMVSSEGEMKVFISSTLNSIVPLNRSGETVNLFIPDYHNYVQR